MHYVFNMFFKDCWGTLSSVYEGFEYQGKEIGSYTVTNHNDCKNKCDRSSDNEHGCHSFTYCPELSGCYLYKIKLNKNMKVLHRKDTCISSYNTCTGKGKDYMDFINYFYSYIVESVYQMVLLRNNL